MKENEKEMRRYERKRARQREKKRCVAFGFLPVFFSYAMLNNYLAYKRTGPLQKEEGERGGEGGKGRKEGWKEEMR